MMPDMRSGRGLALALALVGVVAGGAATAGGHSVDRAGPCGAPGKPACPLQHWMRTRVAAPHATHDLASLATALDQLAAINPDPEKWQNWSKYARDAAKQARGGTLPLLACVNCHKVYRAPYNAKYRERAVSR